MKEKRFFFGWCRRRLGAAALILLLALLYSVLFFLYGLPTEATLYGLALCGTVVLCFAMVDYIRYSARHRTLYALQKEIAFSLEHLPRTTSWLELDYQELLRLIFQDKQAILDRSKAELCDMTDYYTLWAHQIKTPISAMRLLLQGDAPNPDDLQAELLKIEQYVDMVLSYLRLGSNDSDFVIRTCPLDSIIRKAVRKYSRIFILKKLSLRYETCTATVLTDEKWLTFVLEQLLSNALKYTRRGSITITVEEGRLMLCDTGIGIAPEDLPRVFDRGYTGYNGRADQKATGIGLSLCREICKKLGHTISITSEVGVGTTVSLDLSHIPLEVE